MNEKLEQLPAELARALELERARPPVSSEQVDRLAQRIEASFAAMPATIASSAAGAALAGKVGLVVAALAVGAVGGAQFQARFGAPREVVVERRVEVPVRVEVPAAIEAPPAAVPKTKEQKAAAQPALAHPIELERLLIEQAAAAFGRGKGTDALAACQQHERQFPSGQLAEERESIAIRALVSLGRRDEAASRAAAFKQHYPNSLLSDVVDAALR